MSTEFSDVIFVKVDVDENDVRELIDKGEEGWVGCPQLEQHILGRRRKGEGERERERERERETTLYVHMYMYAVTLRECNNDILREKVMSMCTMLRVRHMYMQPDCTSR